MALPRQAWSADIFALCRKIVYVLEEAGPPPCPVLQGFQDQMFRQGDNEAQLSSGQRGRATHQ